MVIIGVIKENAKTHKLYRSKKPLLLYNTIETEKPRKSAFLRLTLIFRRLRAFLLRLSCVCASNIEAQCVRKFTGNALILFHGSTPRQ